MPGLVRLVDFAALPAERQANMLAGEHSRADDADAVVTAGNDFASTRWDFKCGFNRGLSSGAPHGRLLRDQGICACRSRRRFVKN